MDESPPYIALGKTCGSLRISPLRKIQGDFTIMDRSSLITDRTSLFSLLYFDAFAPEKQPEMWTQELFDELYVMMEEEGILTTYCAKGVVRRMLQAAGFIVERLPGPPGGKREILRGKEEIPGFSGRNAM